MNVGIYARISEDREDKGAGVGRQVDDCEAYCNARGWGIFDRYVDNDISAWKGGRRPEYQRMLQDMRDGAIDAVVVWHQDRLVRQPRELEEFFDICDRAGITELGSVSGDIDLGTSDGRFKARILGSVAAKESDDKSRRIKRKMEEIAKTGGPKGGGTRPFGFAADRVTIEPDEAEVVRECAKRVVAGESLRSLCVELRDRGVTTPAGHAWRSTPLRRMLQSARMSGQREHRGEIVAKALWPAIITPEQTAQVRAVFADVSRRAVRAPRSYLLKGLVRCAECESVLVARPRDDGDRRYVCATGPGFSGCGHTYVLSEPLEQFVTEAVLWRLDSPELDAALRNGAVGDAGEWHIKVERLTAKLEELATTYAADRISMSEWMAARVPVQKQLDDARRRVARLASASALAGHIGRGGELRKRWSSLSIDRQHAIIAATLAHVSARAGRRGYNRFDPDRFDLVWRH